MRTARWTILLGLLLGAAPVLAHQAGERALGTIERVTADALVLKAPDGHEITFALSPGTRFEREGKAIPRADVRAGDRAVVEARAAGGRMEARRVRLGPASSAR